MPGTVKTYIRKTQAERREEILDATLKVLGRHGVENTTVARIAEEVGVTAGALYRHFGNRDAIIAAAAQLAIQRALNWVEAVDAPNALDRLMELGRNLAPWQTDNLNTMARPLFQILGSPQKPEYADQMNPLKWPSFEKLVATVEEGKRQGSIRSDVDSEDVVWAMVAFNFTSDMALLSGARSAAEGALIRNLDRLLACFRPEAEPAGEDQ